MWDIVRDSWNDSDIHGGAGILENATLTLDEPKLEAMVIGNGMLAVLLLVKVKFKVKLLILMIMMKVVFDCY